MLEELRIQNFQKHEKLLIKFDKRVTVIVGSSDAGKSAILRALWWVLANTPSGTSFVRDGQKGTTVRAVLDGVPVVRKRGKDTNTYQVGEGQVLKAFGVNPPTQVSDLANVGPDNMQGQHDAPYWFTESAGQVSRNLNAIIDLSVMDDAVATVKQKVNKARQQTETSMELMALHKRRKKELGWVGNADAALSQIETTVQAVEQSEDRLDGLRTETSQAKAARAKKVENALAVFDGKGVLGELRRLAALENKLAEIQKVAARAKQIKSTPKPPSLEKMTGTVNWYREMKENLCMLRDATEAARGMQGIHEEAEEDLQYATKEFKKIEGACPLCGKKK
jgi:DNA repair exonuclease SbcCD ATPase subunit